MGYCVYRDFFSILSFAPSRLCERPTRLPPGERLRRTLLKIATGQYLQSATLHGLLLTQGI